MEKTDVLIIGAGVAGLFAAVNVKTDLKVMVVEKQTFPPDKLCAGLMSIHAYRRIEALHPPISAFYNPATLPLCIVDGNNGLETTVPHPFRNLKRGGFYSWMAGLLDDNASIAERTRPVEISEERRGYRVVLTDDKNRKRELETGCIIAADGARSWTRSFLGSPMPPYVDAIQYRFRNNGELDHAEFVFDPRISQNGYCWIVPQNDEIAIGACMQKGDRRTAPELMAEEYHVDPAWLERQSHPIVTLSHLSQVSLGRGSAMYAGEAAGLVDPLWWEGLSLALESGELAAAAVNENPECPLDTYGKSCRPLLLRLRDDLEIRAAIRDPDARKRYLQSISGA